MTFENKKSFFQLLISCNYAQEGL